MGQIRSLSGSWDPANCNDARIPDYCREYLLDLGREARMEIYAAEDKEFCGQGPKIFFIGSGGTAEPFSRVYRMAQGPYYLLTVPAWNSLAASMEILSYLAEERREGRDHPRLPERYSREDP